MKKRIIILLLISIFSLIVASCNNGESQEDEPKSLYELAVEAGFEGNLEDWCEAVANVNDTTEDEPKSLYELAVEAGFEGTLEEWCEAVANVNNTTKDENESLSQNNITKGEAILIAQNHLFALQPPECSLSLTYTARYIRDDEETWTILVGMYDVNPYDEDYIVKGGGYTYVIEKSTGRIIEIAGGE